MANSTKSGKEKDNELFAQPKLEMVKAHIKFIGFYLFIDLIKEYKFEDQRIKSILVDLAKIVALKSLIYDSGAAYEAGFFAP